MSVTIKRVCRDDAAEVIDYMKLLGGETDNLTFGAEGFPTTVEEEAEYLEEASNSSDTAIFVARDNGRIVGDASLSRMPRRMKHRGDLGIGVLKEYWGRGIGTLLMSEIVRFAGENSFDVIDLQVRCDNAAAIHLYEKFGFRKFGTHPSFFKIGDDEIPFDYMFLELQHSGK